MLVSLWHAWRARLLVWTDSRALACGSPMEEPAQWFSRPWQTDLTAYALCPVPAETAESGLLFALYGPGLRLQA
jgi:hypothetical protein